MAKQEALKKLAVAEKATAQIFQGQRTAIEALSGNVVVNGYGIIRDPSEVRRQLRDAQAAIEGAALLLSAVDWPTDADYDYL